MKLNPDCIRSILLTVEEKCSFGDPWEYMKNDLDSTYLKEYTHEEIIYHISQCEKSRLIDNVDYCDNGDWISIIDLSPHGHQFLADIRSDTNWSNIKEVGKKVGSTSLNSITQIASGVIAALIKNQLGI